MDELKVYRHTAETRLAVSRWGFGGFGADACQRTQPAQNGIEMFGIPADKL
jgi:hypothetical protein